MTKRPWTLICNTFRVPCNLGLELSFKCRGGGDVHLSNGKTLVNGVEVFWRHLERHGLLQNWDDRKEKVGLDASRHIIAGVSSHFSSSVDISSNRGHPSWFLEDSKTWLSKRPKDINTWGTVDILYESSIPSMGFGVYILNISGLQTIPLHFHRKMREVEVPLGDGLHSLVTGLPCCKGSFREWDLDEIHGYENRSVRTQSLLCIDIPRFKRRDEIQCSLPISRTQPGFKVPIESTLSLEIKYD